MNIHACIHVHASEMLLDNFLFNKESEEDHFFRFSQSSERQRNDEERNGERGTHILGHPLDVDRECVEGIEQRTTGFCAQRDSVRAATVSRA